MTHIESAYTNANLTADSFVTFKKELVLKLKEFDKKYVKHGKQMHPILE